MVILNKDRTRETSFTQLTAARGQGLSKRMAPLRSPREGGWRGRETVANRAWDATKEAAEMLLRGEGPRSEGRSPLTRRRPVQ
jgi:hypothetical protein